ncbi:hypothetical protein [Phosphitispora fastidiosa]|uniref:hypothetical protein n=1 Tax=Phosphitispora fastidiosa TaxID=2837202 RepID=UPI001E391B24|nr:hypothetical protein [Phosphitispora fastidiosa]MBU7007739.1 hypothetical protein [Phosphitispora fastidiosa]
MKKRWIVLLGILAVWLTVSLAAYINNTVTMKTMYLPEWKLSEDNPVQIKEIRIINKESKSPEIPDNIWNRLILKSNWVPDSAKYFLVRVIRFYSFTYDKSNSWILEASGCYLDADAEADVEVKSNFPDIDLKINGADVVTQGMSSRGNEESNFRLFTARAQNIGHNVKSIEILWEWNGKNGQQTYTNDFTSISYSFFDSKPGEYQNFDPEVAASEAFWNYLKGKDADGFALARSELEQKLMWIKGHEDMSVQTITRYVGNCAGFDGVMSVKFSCTLEPEITGIETTDVSQVFYLVQQNGKWKIIYIGPADC